MRTDSRFDRPRPAFLLRNLCAATLSATMLLPVVMAVLAVPAARAQTAGDLAGNWQGTLHLPNGQDMRVVFKVEKAADGKLSTTAILIDGQGQRVPSDKTVVDGGNVTISLDAMGGAYEGKMAPDGASIAGNLKLGPQTMPMVLARATTETAWAIPEAPKPPKMMDPKAMPTFETATVKPTAPDEKGTRFTVDSSGAFHSVNMSVETLLTIVYNVNANELIGLPDWAKHDKFDIVGKSDTPGVPGRKQIDMQVQKLLADRFGVKFHREKRDLTAYRITLGAGGPKMKPDTGDPDGLPGLFFNGPGSLNVRNATIADFANLLQSSLLDHPVVDLTGLGEKKFDFTLKWQLDDDQAMKMGMTKAPAPAEGADVPPPLLTAMPEQLGLKMEAGKTEVEVLVFDHVEKPSAN